MVQPFRGGKRKIGELERRTAARALEHAMASWAHAGDMGPARALALVRQTLRDVEHRPVK